MESIHSKEGRRGGERVVRGLGRGGIQGEGRVVEETNLLKYGKPTITD